ncbi:hypothetical protein [Paraburkholderia haematera]|uniref:hypothetical protein n=1 Tax=Paraburkholderia haematera TaxID=2793077 RepID=UPI001B8B7A50|nr:hypothetical protein [Paraburkholderia haematera]
MATTPKLPESLSDRYSFWEFSYPPTNCIAKSGGASRTSARPTIEGVEVAKARLHHLNVTEKLVPGVEKAHPWPDARRRFQALGFEHFYHDLFTPASDSVHTLGEDIFNLLLANSDDTDIRSLSIRSVFSDKMSFSVYVCASVLTFYVEAIYQFSRHIKNEAMEIKAEELAEIVNKITRSMNDDTISDLLTVYPSSITDNIAPA